MAGDMLGIDISHGSKKSGFSAVFTLITPRMVINSDSYRISADVSNVARWE